MLPNAPWLYFGPTADLFEVVWQLVWIIAFAAASFDLYDATLYFAAAKDHGTARERRFALKDVVVAVLLFLMTPPALVLGAVSLTTPHPASPANSLAAIGFRSVFIFIGLMIMAIAASDFRFRWGLAEARRSRVSSQGDRIEAAIAENTAVTTLAAVKAGEASDRSDAAHRESKQASAALSGLSRDVATAQEEGQTRVEHIQATTDETKEVAVETRDLLKGQPPEG